MQRSSYREESDPRLRVYPSAEADRLKRRLVEESPAPHAAVTLLQQIGSVLFAALAKEFALSGRSLTPILVLRGGLVLWQPWARHFGPGRTGLMAPARASHDAVPAISYASVPVGSAPQRGYALVDTLIASGRTVQACAAALAERLGDDAGEIEIVAPFVADRGREFLLSAVPAARIHCIWHDEQVTSDGRMVGPGFDVGEYAMGNTGPSLLWT